jgi:hypothetical protein
VVQRFVGLPICDDISLRADREHSVVREDLSRSGQLPDGASTWQLWLDWHRVVAPDNAVEIKALEDDCGSYLGYVRLVGRRREDVQLPDHITSVPTQYTKKPLLRRDPSVR